MRDIGKNIRDLRIQRNMTQDELAEKLFVTRQTVSNYETGKSRPDIEMLERIAEVLDADIRQVLYGKKFFKEEFGVDVYSVVTMNDIIEAIEEGVIEGKEHLPAMYEYRNVYGAK